MTSTSDSEEPLVHAVAIGGRAPVPPTHGRVVPSVSPPRTKKGRATKEALLAAARQVFGEAGYAGARVSDIAAVAGLSNGAFYRYYSDKREVLVELLSDLLDRLVEGSHAPWVWERPLTTMETSVERYLAFYEANADLFRVLHETVQLFPEIEAMQAEGRLRFQESSARGILRSKETGLMRASVDPQLGAAFLSGIVEHYAYTRFVLHRYPEQAIKSVASAITAFWANGTYVPGKAAFEEHDDTTPFA